MSDFLYRYVDSKTASAVCEGWHEACIQLRTFKVRQETPKGVWIGGVFGEHRQWVSSTSRKRFAYPTVKEALVGFLARKHRQINILRDKLTLAEDAHLLGMGKLKKLEEKLCEE